jgi:hypothetical protein
MTRRIVTVWLKRALFTYTKTGPRASGHTHYLRSVGPRRDMQHSTHNTRVCGRLVGHTETDDLVN